MDNILWTIAIWCAGSVFWFAINIALPLMMIALPFLVVYAGYKAVTYGREDGR